MQPLSITVNATNGNNVNSLEPQPAQVLASPVPAPPAAATPAPAAPGLWAAAVTEAAKPKLVYQLIYPPFPSPHLFIVLTVSSMIVWIFSWLYVGSTWHPLGVTKNLEVGVLNCDTGVNTTSLAATYGQPMGNILSQYLASPLAATLLASSIWSTAKTGPGRLLKWKNFTCSSVPHNQLGCGSFEESCYKELIKAVDHGKIMSGVYLPGEFSSDFLTAFSAADGTKPSLKPLWMQHTYPQGASYTTFGFITRIVTNTAQGVSYNFGSQVVGSLRKYNVTSRIDPTFLLRPLELRDNNLAPVKRFGQNFATYVYCVLLWLGAAFTVSLLYQYKSKTEMDVMDNVRPVSVLEALGSQLSKASVAIGFMFLQSVLLTATLLILDGGQWHYNAGYAIAFGWYMSWSFLSINGVMIHTVGIERFSAVSALLIILQLTASGGVFHEALSPDFFHIGHALPFFYGVRAYRTIFFGSYENLMPANWGVITAWNGACAVVFFTLMVLRVTHKILNKGPISALSPAHGAPITMI